MDFRKIIGSDLYRHDGLKGTVGFVKGWFQPGFRYTFFFRLVSIVHFGPLKFILRLLKRRYRIKYGYEIDSTAKIGKGFYLTDHCGPTIIGAVKIGNNCNVGHCVTIGRTNRDGAVGFPTLGDMVWIGTGAVIVGKINIGSNVLIAPNAYVNVDVPSNSLVIGNPATIIAKENPTTNYMHFVFEEPEK